MAKIMLFIDGTWLYATVPALAKSYGKDFQIDFGRLPRVLADQVQTKLGSAPAEVVRTCLFGSYAANYDERDEESVERRLDFFDMLREEYHYEIDIFPVNFKGRRLRKADRSPGDLFEPKEKCVDIALASSMLYFAAIPGAYDIALAVIGDQDFKPMLQQVRRLGKRVAIASVKGSCAVDFFDPRGEPRLKDFDTIWLDDLLPQLELKFERRQLECQSPMHQGDRKVWTDFRPRRGKPFFCDACREEFNRQKQDAHREFTPATGSEPLAEGATGFETGQRLTGMIYEKKEGRGFGFIRADNGKEYYFHFTDLPVDLRFEELHTGMRVNFELKREPSDNRAGAARNVRRHFEE
jgi:cold shock CspA family protein